MKTSKRFDRAIEKLYTSFHDGSLHPECYKNCAVGNICDNRDFWKEISDFHGSTKLSYVGYVNERLGKTFNGYSPTELLQIEMAFLKGCGYSLPLNYRSHKPKNPESKETLFAGLVSAVSQLCRLDGIPDVMDCSALFQYEEANKDNSLAEVL